ncbi:MAG: hypothetical protein WKG07_26415 [Hymenobacter sp.]
MPCRSWCCKAWPWPHQRSPAHRRSNLHPGLATSKIRRKESCNKPASYVERALLRRQHQRQRLANPGPRALLPGKLPRRLASRAQRPESQPHQPRFHRSSPS